MRLCVWFIAEANAIELARQIKFKHANNNIKGISEMLSIILYDVFLQIATVYYFP